MYPSNFFFLMRTKFLVPFFALSLFLMVGCKNNSNPSSANNNTTPLGDGGRFGYMVNGVAETSKSNPTGAAGSATIYPAGVFGSPTKNFSLSLTNFDVVGLTYHSKSIQIGFPLLSPSTSSYAIGLGSGTSAVASYVLDSLTFSSLPGGSITFTKFDTILNLVSGTFQFSADLTSPVYDPTKVATITGGFFNDVAIGLGAYAQGSITATADAVPFSTQIQGTQAVNSTTNPATAALLIIAESQDPRDANALQSIELSIGMPVLGKTYSLASDPITGGAYGASYRSSGNTGASNNVSITSASGSLVVTAADAASRRFSATFSFSGTDATTGRSLSVTNGQINNVQWSVAKTKQKDPFTP
jgi:hypothetical protein